MRLPQPVKFTSQLQEQKIRSALLGNSTFDPLTYDLHGFVPACPIPTPFSWPASGFHIDSLSNGISSGELLCKKTINSEGGGKQKMWKGVGVEGAGGPFIEGRLGGRGRGHHNTLVANFLAH